MIRFEDLKEGDTVVVRDFPGPTTLRTVLHLNKGAAPSGAVDWWVRFQEGGWAKAASIIGVAVMPPVVLTDPEPFVWCRTDDESIQWPDDKTMVLFLAERGEQPVPIREKRVDAVRCDLGLIDGWWMICPRPQVIVSRLKIADDRPGSHLSGCGSPCIHVVNSRECNTYRSTWCNKAVAAFSSFIPETVNDIPKKRKCKVCNNPKNKPNNT